MIDLSPMGGVRVDPVRRRAWVQGGALLGAARQRGAAVRPGDHGGQRLAHRRRRPDARRRDGLARPAVRADLRQRYLVPGRDGRRRGGPGQPGLDIPDLYWALRGGGGNFGVVTEFEFRLHPVGTRALLAELSFPVSGAAAGRALDALRGWRDLLSCAPRRGHLHRVDRERRHGGRRLRLGRRPGAGPAAAPGAARTRPAVGRARARAVLPGAAADVRHRAEARAAPLLQGALPARAAGRGAGGVPGAGSF